MSSIATSAQRLDKYHNIKCESLEIKEYVQGLELSCKYLRDDLAVLGKAPKDFTIKWMDSSGMFGGRKARGGYNSLTITVTKDAESVCHEVHHAAQHASMLGSSNCETIWQNNAYLAALEFSAIASGLIAGNSNCTIGGNFFQTEVESIFKAYVTSDNRANVLKKLSTATDLEFCRARIKELELKIPDA